MKSITKLLLSLILTVAAIIVLAYVVSFREATIVLWAPILIPLLIFCGLRLKEYSLMGGAFLIALYACSWWWVDSLFYLFGASTGRMEMLADTLPKALFFIAWGYFVIILPLSFLAVKEYGYHRSSLLVAAIFYGAIVLPFSYAFAHYDANINCVLYPCDWDSDDFRDSLQLGYFFPIHSDYFRYASLGHLVKEVISFCLLTGAAHLVMSRFSRGKT